ncbi:MAG: hypothetical protein GF344_13135 [Chitinivibrionales bacterium]|nr:hypothetical protein [Chitinivibrionales bacterium]
MRQFQKSHPGDRRAAGMIAEMEKMKTEAPVPPNENDSAPSVDSPAAVPAMEG